MEALQAVKEGLSMADLGKALVTILILVHFQRSSRTNGGGSTGAKPSHLAEYLSISGFVLLFLFARAWLALVTYYVPEPYLDEVFHIPQAQAYCKGFYFHWDDKITTPPGLYALSVLYQKLWRLAACTPFSLRSTNVHAILQLALVASLCRSLIEDKLAERKGQESPPKAISLYAMHTAFNIALFPVLFFFSALYYTDVVSTLFVLLAYQNHLRRTSPGDVTFLNDIWTILLGVASLLMRQTNIFWVVVYMGGLEVVHGVKQLQPSLAHEPYFTTLDQLVRHYARSYSLGDVHDPPLNVAWLDDWLFCGISVGIAALVNPFRVFRQVWPHITVLFLFAGFVVWNGSVVLGDKSNHIATLHLSQMLYIWPLFAFFSAPLLLPSLLPYLSLALLGFTSLIQRKSASVPLASRTTATHTTSNPPPAKTSRDAPAGASKSKADKNRPLKRGAQSTDTRPPQSALLRRVQRFFYSNTIYLFYWPASIIVPFFIVRYNTIIHPFTLADNRHYMFYAFRYTILRAGWWRYCLVFAYTFCRWRVWACLEGCSFIWLSGVGRNPECPASVEDLSIRHINAPFTRLSELRSRLLAVEEKEAGKATENEAQEAELKSQPEESIFLSSPSSASALSPTTSTALLWLLATTLSLITAPLVEPRYFILPWVTWRLLVPAWPAHECTDADGDGEVALEDVWGLGWLFRVGKKLDMRLVLETAWFVAINVVTMWIFLFRPFYWRAEDGTVLDAGRVQRFMW